jgi:hypothetical protein
MEEISDTLEKVDLREFATAERELRIIEGQIASSNSSRQGSGPERSEDSSSHL